VKRKGALFVWWSKGIADLGFRIADFKKTESRDSTVRAAFSRDFTI
jgi:hypothetical protein